MTGGVLLRLFGRYPAAYRSLAPRASLVTYGAVRRVRPEAKSKKTIARRGGIMLSMRQPPASFLTLSLSNGTETQHYAPERAGFRLTLG